MWSFWGTTELEPKFLQIGLQKVLPEDQRNLATRKRAESAIERPLAVLDQYLANHEHLLEGDFTIADLNVIGALSLMTFADFDISKWANIARWLGSCTSRPALSRALSKS